MKDTLKFIYYLIMYLPLEIHNLKSITPKLTIPVPRILF
jgi:hypothetical protein